MISAPRFAIALVPVDMPPRLTFTVGYIARSDAREIEFEHCNKAYFSIHLSSAKKRVVTYRLEYYLLQVVGYDRLGVASVFWVKEFFESKF